jgi:hypothetical protein
VGALGLGVMCLHGIERDRPMGDVDIFVATRVWFDLLFGGLYKTISWTAKIAGRLERLHDRTR